MQDTGKNLIIAGVGGQGILLFSNLLSKYYMKLGYELKISDVMRRRKSFSLFNQTRIITFYKSW